MAVNDLDSGWESFNWSRRGLCFVFWISLAFIFMGPIRDFNLASRDEKYVPGIEDHLRLQSSWVCLAVALAGIACSARPASALDAKKPSGSGSV